MSTSNRPTIHWMELLWLVFLAGLAMLPPVLEIHKQLLLLAFGVVQLGEAWFISRVPRRGPAYMVLIKIGLATLLIDHTGELSINSSYYPIYYLPVVTAAEYFGPWATLAWTALASATYCSYLYPALQDYDVSSESYSLLAINNRDPETNRTDLGTTLRLAELVQDRSVLVTEGGVQTRDDVRKLVAAGVRITTVEPMMMTTAGAAGPTLADLFGR